MIRHFAGVAEIVEDFEAAVPILPRHSRAGSRIPRRRLRHRHHSRRSFTSESGPRAEAAEATYGSPDAADRVPLGFTHSLRGGQRNRGRTASRQCRRRSGSAHQDRTMGTGNQPLHNAQRCPLRNCRNPLGAPHHAADVGRVGRHTLTNPPRTRHCEARSRP